VSRPAIAVLAIAIWTVVTASAQTFRARVALVHLPVAVTSGGGDPVKGLQSADFEVLDNGRRQDVTAFAAGDSAALPLHLGLMLDRSLSMEADAEAAASAAVKFVGLMESAVDVTLVEFDAGVRLSHFGAGDYLRLYRRIRETRLGPHTVFYEALARYLQRIERRDGQHILVAYTDGGDESSRLTASDARDLLRAGHAILYVVGYLAHQPQAHRIRQQALLSMLARETGGDAFFPESARALTQAYDRIRREIEGRYTLGFVPSDPGTPGQFRRIEVRVKTPSGKALRLRTRSGYIGASPP
jgi:Ca-activated chloride channel family protein